MRATIWVGLILLVACGLLVMAQDGQPPSAHEQVVRDMLRALEDLGTTMSNILDADTAAAAQPALKKSVGLLLETRKKAAALPQPNKTEKDRIARTFQRKLSEAVEKFRSEQRRLEGIPAAEDALKELAPLQEKKGDRGKE